PATLTIRIADSEQPDTLPTVDVVVRAPGFEILGGNTRTMTVQRDTDVDERFRLIPKRTGAQQIRVDFYQFERRIGTEQRAVLVEDPAAVAGGSATTPASATAPATATLGPITLTTVAVVPAPD